MPLLEHSHHRCGNWPHIGGGLVSIRGAEQTARTKNRHKKLNCRDKMSDASDHGIR